MLNKSLWTLLGLILVISVAGCAKEIEEEKKSEAIQEPFITGIIRNAEGRTLDFNRGIPNGMITLESVKIDEHGKFTIRTKVQDIDFYCLSLKSEESEESEESEDVIYLIIDGTENIAIDANAEDHFATATVTFATANSTDSLEAKETILLRELQAHFKADDNEERAAAWARKFAKDHPESLVLALLAEWLDPEVDLELMKTISQNLSARFPNIELVKYFTFKFQVYDSMQVGKIAPDFTIKTPDDKDISVHDFRGSFVLVDFWWHNSDPAFVACYEKYRDKGFTIFSVGIYQDKAEWEEAIKDNGFVWSQGSDLKGWDSPLVHMRGIRPVPFNVLLDKEGIILAKSLRGEDLDKKLAEIFQ